MYGKGVAEEKTIFFIGIVILALLFGFVLIVIAGNVFPKLPDFICNFVKPLYGLPLTVGDNIKNIIPGCK